MKWLKNYDWHHWALVDNDGLVVASIHERNKSFFASCGAIEKHFSAYGIFKFQAIEVRRAKKWCEKTYKSRNK